MLKNKTQSTPPQTPREGLTMSRIAALLVVGKAAPLRTALIP
jgi:hypothetical protein